MTRPEHRRDPATALAGSVWDGVGSSMLPFVLPGSRLHLRFAGDERLRAEPGDVVCYLGANEKIVAHRVVGQSGRDGAVSYTVKGDAQAWTEQVGEEALLAVVTRVEQRVLSYDTDGPLGAGIAHLAVKAPALVNGAAALARLLIRARRLALDLTAAARGRPHP